MNKISIITSVDYELFGDGSGDVQREQIQTTQSLINIADKYGVKLTIMFEYGQYLAYEKFSEYNAQLTKDNEKILQQLISLVKGGHDVQLHYHPQWENATYDLKKDRFDVNLETIDISSLNYDRIVSILKDGKKFLEKLLTPYNENYKCIGFRAGSWAVKNQKKVLKALMEAGFKSDSSVVPNVKFESEQVNFKYANCPYQYHFWYVDKCLTKQSLNKNFLEIPIYTKKNIFSLFKYINYKYFRSRKIVNQLYKVKISERNFSIFQKIVKVLLRDYYMADLNTMSAKTLIEMVEEGLFEKKFSEEELVPIMFICHSKTSYALDDLHVFYQYLRDNYKNNIEYSTYQDVIEKLVSDKK